MTIVRSPVIATLRSRKALIALTVCATGLVSGCATLSSWLPSWLTAPPSLSSLIPWYQSGPKVGPLPAFDAKATAQLNWQVSLGGSGGAGFAPSVRADAVYAAATDGTLVSVDPATGRQRWRSNAAKPLSAGVGADASVLLVGTNKGEVLAFDASGKPLWQAKVPSEVSGPPKLADGTAIVWSLDGKIFGLSAADGSRKWVYQRTTPPLTVRRFAGGIVDRGGLFTGTPGGKLLAINVATGALAWEGNVATPKGRSSTNGRYAPQRTWAASRVSMRCEAL